MSKEDTESKEDAESSEHKESKDHAESKEHTESTQYTDQFFIIDPGNPPKSGTALQVQQFDFCDSNNDNLIRPNAGDTFNGLQITSVWQGDRVTVRMNGVSVTIEGVTFYTSGGPAVFTPTDGTILSDAVFRHATYVTESTETPVGKFGPPCFAQGTLIETAHGPRAIETLMVGDMVITRDQGPQPLRWVGFRVCAGGRDNAPIRFAQGAIGNSRTLLVSPQHRILVTGWKAQLYFGAEEVLMSAKHLTNGDTICRAPCRMVTYHHLLFDRHQIVCSEGAATESLYPGDTMLRDNPQIAAEIDAIFPTFATQTGRSAWRTARPTAGLRTARVLMAA